MLTHTNNTTPLCLTLQDVEEIKKKLKAKGFKGK